MSAQSLEVLFLSFRAWACLSWLATLEKGRGLNMPTAIIARLMFFSAPQVRRTEPPRRIPGFGRYGTISARTATCLHASTQQSRRTASLWADGARKEPRC